MGHKLGDVDSLGAAIGLYRAAATLDRKARIVINDITAPLRPVVEKFKSDGEYPEDLFINSSQAMEAVTRNTVVIVADVNRPSVTECQELLEMSDYVVVLDHHRQTRDSTFVLPPPVSWWPRFSSISATISKSGELRRT